MYVDAHAHLDKYADDELDDVLDTIQRRRILTLSVSVDVPSFLRTKQIAAHSDLVVPSFGVHPEEAHHYVDSLADLDEYAEHSPMFGVLGLDHRVVTDERLYPTQRQVFEWFLDRARAQHKLVTVHCVGAERDTAEILGRYGDVRTIIHWYSGPLDVLAGMIDMGFMFSIGIEILHSDHIRDVAASIPSAQLLTETDNPGGPRWVTGDAGYPSLIAEIVGRLAVVRGATRDALMSTVRANMGRLIANDDHLRPYLDRLES